MDSGLEGRRLLRGFRTFAVITVVAFVLLGALTTDETTWRSLARLRPEALLFVLGLVFVSWFTTAVKIRILVSGIGSRIGVWKCLRAHLANMFLSAVTPFQTGGGPAQIYVLWHYGLTISRATAASLIGALITILTLFLSGVVVLVLKPGLVENVAVRLITGFVIAVFGLVFFLFWVAFFKPAWAAAVVRGGASLAARIPGVPADRVWRLHDRFSRELTDLIGYLRSYMVEARGSLVRALPLGILSIIANCLIAYAVLYGMGIRRDPVEVFLAQILIYFIVYFSPSPGGSGVAEAGGASIMAALVPTHQLAVYVVLWRFFSYLLGVGLGALAILGLLKRRAGAPRAAVTPAPITGPAAANLETAGLASHARDPVPGGKA
jgi:uncharacterized protein (TIRG00374 family)